VNNNQDQTNSFTFDCFEQVYSKQTKPICEYQLINNIINYEKASKILINIQFCFGVFLKEKKKPTPKSLILDCFREKKKHIHSGSTVQNFGQSTPLVFNRLSSF